MCSFQAAAQRASYIHPIPARPVFQLRTSQGEEGAKPRVPCTAVPSAQRALRAPSVAIDSVSPCRAKHPAVFFPNTLLTKLLLSMGKCQLLLPDPQELPGPLDRMKKLWLPLYTWPWLRPEPYCQLWGQRRVTRDSRTPGKGWGLVLAKRFLPGQAGTWACESGLKPTPS